MFMRKTGYLVLENGMVLSGKLFGAEKEIMAEMTFTTDMVGYLGTLSDPSYLGQMVVQTFPMIGNYGLIPEAFEAEKPALAAYVAREICQDPSNFRSIGNLEAFLKEKGIPGIMDVDTRYLTKLIRHHGAMNAAIVHAKPQDLDKLVGQLKALSFHPSVKEVTCKEAYTLGEGKCHVAVMDFGVKKSIIEKLVELGCRVTVVPCDTKAEAVLSLKPDGILLSNGPGDPNDNPAIIEEIKKLKASNVPMLGICLGHGLLAASQGAKMEKLKYGHRGAGQPAKELKTGRSFMTAQNHSYAVSMDALPKNAVATFAHINDFTCEGLEYTDGPAFSVQFIPAVNGGPLDTMFVYNRFIATMGGNK